MKVGNGITSTPIVLDGDMDGDYGCEFDDGEDVFSENEIDIDDDGDMDGYDHNKDGVLDHNKDNIPITGLETVEGHYRDGQYVEEYQRTIADDSTKNNLNPKK